MINYDTLRSFSNGRIPEELLVPIGYDRLVLLEPAARAFRSMWVNADKDGVKFSVKNAYLPYELQPVPGTSDNGWGLTVDFYTENHADLLEWLRANAYKYGFQNSSSDPGHWVYLPGRK
jgi:LAS superfamily LD-carboxypeptidase LdcB